MAEYVKPKNTYRISWVNEDGKTVGNWVKQTGKDSYWVLKKDGSKMETKSKGGLGLKVLVLAEGDIKSKNPAVMNKKYAELEVVRKRAPWTKMKGLGMVGGGGKK